MIGVGGIRIAGLGEEVEGGEEREEIRLQGLGHRGVREPAGGKRK